MSWRRPVPLLGDPSSSRERGAQLDGWAFGSAEREALHAIIRARRDVRRFRPDPVPDEVLTRVLTAAHEAPSVGHSQPWRFIVVQDAGVRDRAALLADRERLRQAAQLDAAAGRKLLDLQLEGIREAPLGIVVCCDRRAPARGVLGRATFADADLWSCACSIENMWLAARADGLGLGWVTLFRPTELAELLHLPEGVVTLGWLCLGWPDERPPAPGLERAGWSRRNPLADVVLRERWPTPADRAVDPPVSHLRAPDQRAVVGARDFVDDLLSPEGSLGALDRALDRLSALGRGAVGPGELVLVGADHPVAALGVSAYEPWVTAEVLTAAVAGEAMGTTAARSAGMRRTVVDAGVGSGSITGAVDARPLDHKGDLVNHDGLSEDDVLRLIVAGRRLGESAARQGLVALGEVGIGNTTVASALTAALLGVDARSTVGRGAGADTAMLDRKVHVVEAAVARARRRHGRRLSDPLTTLAALGGAEFAVLAGVVLGASVAGAGVILDGFATSVAALLAIRIEPAGAAHLVAAHRSREGAHALVLEELGQEPLLDLRIRAGEGVGACLVVPLLRAAAETRRSTARTRLDPS